MTHLQIAVGIVLVVLVALLAERFFDYLMETDRQDDHDTPQDL